MAYIKKHNRILGLAVGVLSLSTTTALADETVVDDTTSNEAVSAEKEMTGFMNPVSDVDVLNDSDASTNESAIENKTVTSATEVPSMIADRSNEGQPLTTGVGLRSVSASDVNMTLI